MNCNMYIMHFYNGLKLYRVISMNVDVNTYNIYFSGGDQLAAGSGLITIYHHGIYVGGEEVIEYNDDSKIHRISLTKFKNGQPLLRVRYTKSPTPLEPEKVVTKAEDACTENDFGQYNTFNNNCEHFATHCKFGILHSQQVADILQIEDCSDFC